MSPRSACLLLTLLATTLPGAVDAATPSTRNIALAKGCAPSITVSNDNDSGDGSLRAAVAAACTGGVIDFTAPFVIDMESENLIDKAQGIEGQVFAAVGLALAGAGRHRE